MVAYMSKYIINFYSQCEPQRKLTKTDAKFEWWAAQEARRQQPQPLQSSFPTTQNGKHLSSMTKSKRIRSEELFRKTEHEYQPVNYVSKVMTSTERR